MSIPKSVVKVKKNGVEYTSNVDKCQYYMFELTRAALRDAAKFCVKRFRENYYSVFKRHTGDAGRATKYKVYSNKNTKYPRVEIGLPHAHRGNPVDGFYAYFQEVGSSKQPKLGLLTKTVQSNIAEIIKIESQYLSALEDEARVQQLISEKEYESDTDG